MSRSLAGLNVAVTGGGNGIGRLVNNAGVDWVGPFHAEPDDVSRREAEVNLLGTILGTRRMLPRREGHIVYSATKHVAAAVLRAVRDERFELWVPSSQGVTAKLGFLLAVPRVRPD